MSRMEFKKFKKPQEMSGMELRKFKKLIDQSNQEGTRRSRIRKTKRSIKRMAIAKKHKRNSSNKKERVRQIKKSSN